MNRSLDSRKISNNLTCRYVTRVQHVCAIGGLRSRGERTVEDIFEKIAGNYPNLMKTRN